MAHPRFLFMSGGNTFSWRLVGANNRELGRDAGTHPDLRSCREAVAELRAGIDRTDWAMAADASGAWAWRMTLDDRVVANAGRSYQRQRECLFNLKQFVAAVPVAVVTESLVSKATTHRPH